MYDGAERAAAALAASCPGLQIAGHHAPAFGFERDPALHAETLMRVVETKPDFVFVGLGFPKQERLIAYLRNELPRAWFLGVGFSLSFVAGHSARAPSWMSRLGLEWLHRLAQEPRRLARRYLVEDIPFALRLFGAALRARRRGHRESAPTAEPAVRVVFPYGAIERERAQLLEELMRSE